MNAVVLDKYKVFVLCLCGACTIMPVNGVELTTEPELNFGIQYDDNVRLLSISPESSTAYTLSPAVKFVAEEHLLWDVSFNARGKMTRFQDVEDIDSDNVLLELDGGSSTELTALRLKLSLDKNSNFYEKNFSL